MGHGAALLEKEIALLGSFCFFFFPMVLCAALRIFANALGVKKKKNTDKGALKSSDHKNLHG